MKNSKTTLKIVSRITASLLFLTLTVFSLSGCFFFLPFSMPDLSDIKGQSNSDKNNNHVYLTEQVTYTDIGIADPFEPPYEFEEEESEDVAETESPRETTTEEKYASHLFLDAVNVGSCKTLSGDVGICVVFVNDSVSSWVTVEKNNFLDSYYDEMSELKQIALSYGVDLTIHLRYTSSSISVAAQPDSSDWIKTAATGAGFESLDKMATELKQQFSYKECAVVFVLNKQGRAYAQSRSYNTDKTEYCVLYAGEDASKHELLHLFGAQDYYYPKEVTAAANELLPNSIMNSGDDIDELSAYTIGWMTTLSESSILFLERTAHLTEADLNNANSTETFTGYGTREYNDGAVYTGDLVFGVPHGYGKMVFSSGDTYEGEWSNNSMHGSGTYTWANGDVYKGEWANNNMHGEGKMTWTNGISYSGDWVEGKKHGKGTYTYSNGDVYSGDMNQDRKHGYGVYTWKDGSKYEGDWVNDKREGYGVYTWTNGNKYEGYWKNSQMHGSGKFTYSSGVSYVGTWINGEYQN